SVILDDHSRYHQSWDWLTTYELTTGSGWSRSSQTGEYLVCDLQETATKSTNSWLISNFIDLQGAISVTVYVEFTARECDLQSLPFCKQSFNLHYYQTDSIVPSGVQKSTILTGHFSLASQIRALNVWSSGQARIYNNATAQFSVQTRGIYLGFQDTGGCIALGKVRVSYNVCPAQIIGGASYSRTPSPPLGGALKVYGNCGVNSASLRNSTSLYIECLSNGSWRKPENEAKCFCKPGYQITSQGCQACPPGTYKQVLSNSVCTACPENSNSDHSKQNCVCNSGYYRGPKDNKDGKCSAPPTAPRNLSVIFQDLSVIVVAWMPPSDSGGRSDVVYDITCFQCDSNGNCNNRQPCDGRMQYWPKKENNKLTHVTLTGLQPNTSYVLRVAAENGVSYLYGPNSNRIVEIQFGTKISAKMILDKTYVDDATAVLTWRTVDNPHKFSSYDRYEIMCFKCEDGGDNIQHQCMQTCGSDIRYWPGREGLKDNHVTVSELQPSTLYKFVLYVWNSQTALASVLVQTSAASKAATQARFFTVPMILAIVLAGILFVSAVFILLVTFHLKRRWYNIARKGAEKDSPIGKTYSAENTEDTIIMEEILQDYGHSITNGNRTD
ncbi:unnamed protein product, partial [Porites lobata]